jgi:endonuclease YncB( thermonuclease family)
MKRNLIVLSALVLLITAACASVTAPGTTGVVTSVDGNTVTIAGANGQSTTYTLTSSTYVYNASGSRANKMLLSNGQRVMVWSKADNTAVRINIES